MQISGRILKKHMAPKRRPWLETQYRPDLSVRCTYPARGARSGPSGPPLCGFRSWRHVYYTCQLFVRQGMCQNITYTTTGAFEDKQPHGPFGFLLFSFPLLFSQRLDILYFPYPPLFGIEERRNPWNERLASGRMLQGSARPSLPPAQMTIKTAEA